MNSPAEQVESPETIQVELRDPRWAAFLAWLIPGAGHFYQGRYHKGILFSVCILGTFFYGLYLGGGKVVYASARSGDRRAHYLCQVAVGLPALPAVVQAYRSGKRPPATPLWGGFMAPPRMPGAEGPNDPGELHYWQLDLHAYFELGTVFTMIAGLLNVLAIYDAFAGPLLLIAPKNQSNDKQSKNKPPDDKSADAEGDST